MSRVAAKTEGRTWPEQAVAADPIRFRKPDEVRIARQSRVADESSLFNTLPLDHTDEREIAPGEVKIDDWWKPAGSIRLDESKFTRTTARPRPLRSKRRSGTLPGRIRRPAEAPAAAAFQRLLHPPPAGSYESTIDQEQGETAPPALIIRPEAASPTAPRRPS